MITINGISIGDKFYKPINKGKSCLCEVSTIVERKSLVNSQIIGHEYWAISIDKNYSIKDSFQVSKFTIQKGKI